MRGKEEIIKEIVSLLNNYAGEVKTHAKFNWTDKHIHAEYFLKQFLFHVYGWKLKHVAEVYKPNAPDIDLLSDTDKIVIQVTAQSSHINSKIEKTLTGFRKNWKDNYPKLKIFFIAPFIDKKNKIELKNDEVEVLYFERIIAEIEGKSIIEVHKIYEFLLQELSPAYNGIRTLGCFNLFDIDKGGELRSVVSNTEQYKNNLLYYNDIDKKVITELTDVLLKNKNVITLLNGAPCFGKTTLTFELVNRIKGHLIKPFYIDLREYNESNAPQIKNEISKISLHDSFIIVDNAQENDELAKRIHAMLVSENMRALFITRFTSDDSTDLLSEKHFALKINLNDNIKVENIKSKIVGIINNRVHYLKKTYPDKNWLIGNIDTILNHSELNYLKLSIILFFWEKDHYNCNLDEINEEKFYTSFYDEHGLKQADDIFIDHIFKYASLYQYDIPFSLINRDKALNQIIFKGVIIKPKFSDYYIFQYHTEYAKLLAKAISYKHSYDINREAQVIIEYIKSNAPHNTHVLVNQLCVANRFETFNTILADKECSIKIAKHYQKNHISYRNIISLFQSLSKIFSEVDSENVKCFLQYFINEPTNILFKLFESDGECAYHFMKKYLKLYGLDEVLAEKYVARKDKSFTENLNTKTFFELTGLITSQTQNKYFVNNVLCSYNFSVWKEKLEQQKKETSLIIEGLSNLQSNSQSRQLAIDLYWRLEDDEIFEQIKHAPLNVIGKALSDLSEFEAIDYKSKPRQLFNMLYENGSIRKSIDLGLRKYSISISHLSKADNQYLNELFPNDIELNMLLEKSTAKDLFQSIPELIRTFPDKKSILIEAMRNCVIQDSFLHNPDNDLNGLIKLIDLVKQPEYFVSEKIIANFTESALSKISSNENLIHIAEAVNKFKTHLSDQEALFLIDSKKISNALNSYKISLKQLEPIIYDNLKKRSVSFAHDIFINIPIKSFIAATQNHLKPVSFEQITKFFFQMYKLEKEYHNQKGNKIFTSYTKNIIHSLIKYHGINLMNKANKANVFDFITGYNRMYDIDSIVAETNFYSILVQKQKEKNMPEITLSIFPQSVRVLFNLKCPDNKYKKIATDILPNAKPFLKNSADSIDIGKISAGLIELSFEFKQFTEDLFWDLRFDIIEKVKSEKTRHDMENRIIPELQVAAGRHQSIIEELKRIIKTQA